MSAPEFDAFNMPICDGCEFIIRERGGCEPGGLQVDPDWSECSFDEDTCPRWDEYVKDCTACDWMEEQ